MPRVVQGFSVGQYTPENVLRGNGLDARASVDDLVLASAKHDSTNPGYLSQAELQKGAEDLLVSLAGAPTTTSQGSFDYARSVLAHVKDEYLSGIPGRTFSDDEVIGTAALWDDGNGYLKKKELEAGAMELQMTAQSGQPLSAANIAAIRSWTGSERRATTPVQPPNPPPAGGVELGVVSDIDKTLMPAHRTGDPEPAAYPGAAALLMLLEKGPSGSGALGDVTYVTARNPGRVTNMDAWLLDNDLPAGSVETGTSAVPWIAEDEKVRDITRVFEANPGKQFVLFGDSSHRDPDVYRRIRDAFPDQVKAVVIHDVKTIDATRLAGHIVVKHYAEAAAALFGKGIIDEAGARGVIAAAVGGGVALTATEIDALLDRHRP